MSLISLLPLVTDELELQSQILEFNFSSKTMFSDRDMERDGNSFVERSDSSGTPR